LFVELVNFCNKRVTNHLPVGKPVVLVVVWTRHVIMHHASWYHVAKHSYSRNWI